MERQSEWKKHWILVSCMRIEEVETEGKRINLANSGDMRAMQELIEMHMPLIRVLASRLHARYIEKEVFIQAGIIGLMQAIRHYRHGMNVKLITYAIPWILGEMKKALHHEASNGISLEGIAETPERSTAAVLHGCEGVDIAGVDLRMALERLSDDLRMVVCLRYLRDKTQKETALLLKKSQAQISRMERQALDALHVYLS